MITHCSLFTTDSHCDLCVWLRSIGWFASSFTYLSAFGNHVIIVWIPLACNGLLIWYTDHKIGQSSKIRSLKPKFVFFFGFFCFASDVGSIYKACLFSCSRAWTKWQTLSSCKHRYWWYFRTFLWLVWSLSVRLHWVGISTLFYSPWICV